MLYKFRKFAHSKNNLKTKGKLQKDLLWNYL